MQNIFTMMAEKTYAVEGLILIKFNRPFHLLNKKEVALN